MAFCMFTRPGKPYFLVELHPQELTPEKMLVCPIRPIPKVNNKLIINQTFLLLPFGK